MTQNTPNWDSISASIGFIKDIVTDFTDEFKDNLTEAAFPDKVEEAEVGEVTIDPYSEAVRVLKKAEEAADKGQFMDSNQYLQIADRYNHLHTTPKW